MTALSIEQVSQQDAHAVHGKHEPNAESTTPVASPPSTPTPTIPLAPSTTLADRTASPQMDSATVAVIETVASRELSAPHADHRHPVVQDLLQFIAESPTAWHAVREAQRRLDAAGFKALSETDAWTLQPGGKYYVTRNRSSIAAFILPAEAPTSSVILGAHTDSPCLKLKPNPVGKEQNSAVLYSEYYGGPLLPSWTNRDLALAGRVIVEKADGTISQRLVYHRDPVAFIPHLAPHFDRSLTTEHKLNPQAHLKAIVGISGEEGNVLESLLRTQFPFKRLISHELFLVPSEAPNLVGPKNEMIAAWRQDDLLGTHASISALLANDRPEKYHLKMICCWDNEEIGSRTAQGAVGTFLSDVRARIDASYQMTAEQTIQLNQNSLLVSNDVAHAVNPCYADKHDPHHHPLLGNGPVVKFNAKQRYATDAISAAFVETAAQRAGVSIQNFVARNDCPCGSTIGPITAAEMGIKTVDVGSPIQSMHSIRELGACSDHVDMCKLLTVLLNSRWSRA